MAHQHIHARSHDHGSAHDHDHDHDHDLGGAQDDHHGHAHDPAAVVTPGLSLLRMSALERLAGAAVLSTLIWAGVRWATT